MSGDPIKKDNPLMAAARGDFFIPLERVWASDRRLMLSMITDAAVLGGFLLLVMLLSF